MTTSSLDTNGSLFGALVAAARDHYKLAGAAGALIGALLVIYYCGSIGHYPAGLTVADTLFFLWVIAVFGFYYSVVVFGFFLASLFWVALLSKPANWILKVTKSKLNLVVPFPSSDRFFIFGGGLLANFFVVGISVAISHSLMSIVGSFVLMGFAYTLLDHVTKKPWGEQSLVSASGEKLSRARVSLGTAKLILCGMIYLAPLLWGNVGGGVTLTTFQTMGVRIAHVDVVVPANEYQTSLKRLNNEGLLKAYSCDSTVCTVTDALILFTGVGTNTKLQLEGPKGFATLVIPTAAIKLLTHHRPNKSLQVTFDPPPTFAFAKAGVASNAPELRRYAAMRPSQFVRLP